jgi:hypothetical protein
VRKKRTYEEAFGQASRECIEKPDKKGLLKSRLVVESAAAVEEYSIGIETVKAVNSDLKKISTYN